jgi:hypothetical protein
VLRLTIKVILAGHVHVIAQPHLQERPNHPEFEETDGGMVQSSLDGSYTSDQACVAALATGHAASA